MLHEATSLSCSHQPSFSSGGHRCPVIWFRNPRARSGPRGSGRGLTPDCPSEAWRELETPCVQVTLRSPSASARRVPILSTLYTRLLPSSHATTPSLDSLPLKKKFSWISGTQNCLNCNPWCMIIFLLLVHAWPYYLPTYLPTYVIDHI